MTEIEPEPLKAPAAPRGVAENNIETIPSADPGGTVADYDLRILQSLRRIIRAVDLHSHKLSMQHHITGPQLACLLTIGDQGPMTASSLAREVCLSPSTIVGILDRLEQKELVARARSHLDRRVVFIEITGKGQDLLGSAPPSLQNKLAAGLQELPEDEQITIAASLEKIVALMEADTLPAAPFLEAGVLLPGELEEKRKA